MNYDELGIRERYNECMYDERDIIEKFLKDQYDLRYGRQRDSWHFGYEIEVVSSQGSLVKITDIMLDKDCVVKFHVKAFGHDYSWWECHNFAYGELSKVIEALPDADEIVRQNAIDDLGSMCQNLRVDLLLNENGGFSCKIGEHNYIVDDVTTTDEELQLVHAGCANCSSEFPTELLTKLRDHINIEVLHRYNEYNKLVKFLSEQPNLRFEPADWGHVMFTIHGTDVKVDVLSASLDSNGKLQLSVDDDGQETIYFEEKDIRPEYLVDLVGYIEDHCRCDIMDTYNGHNPELVRKINAAWKSPKYHDRLGDILFALGCRDKQEIMDKFDVIIDCNETAMDNAHEIMEGVCDDLDLECILNFIRYED